MVDTNQYPDDRDLEVIRSWMPWLDCVPGSTSHGRWVGWRPLMAYVRERWVYADAGYWTERGPLVRVATAGWSGNEELVQAMRKNFAFWAQCHILTLASGLCLFNVGDNAARGRLHSDLVAAIDGVIWRFHPE